MASQFLKRSKHMFTLFCLLTKYYVFFGFISDFCLNGANMHQSTHVCESALNQSHFCLCFFCLDHFSLHNELHTSSSIIISWQMISYFYKHFCNSSVPSMVSFSEKIIHMGGIPYKPYCRLKPGLKITSGALICQVLLKTCQLV